MPRLSRALVLVVVAAMLGGSLRAVAQPAPVAAQPALQRPPSPAETVVVIGAAPGIDTSPAAAAASVPRAHIERRTPEHLVQVLEILPGVGQVSEAHAAVPAIRGLARGRTVLLLDGARVTSERRVGPAATFLNPLVIEGADVARGPGAVEYGADALGGVVAVRTRSTTPGEAWSARGTTQWSTGSPLAAGALAAGGTLGPAGLFVGLHERRADDYRGPAGIVRNSSWADRGVLVAVSQRLGGGLLTSRYQGDEARDVERPRTNSDVLRIVSPFERSRRITAAWDRPGAGGAGGWRVLAFHGWTSQRTEQQALAGGVPRTGERADLAARDLHLRGTGHRHVANVAVEGGVEMLGRYGLQSAESALDFLGPSLVTATTQSVEDARRVGVGAFVKASVPLGRRVTLAGGARADDVRTRSRGVAYGARHSRHALATGFLASSMRASDALSITAQLSRGFRDPSLSDRYVRGPSGRGLVIGNPDLRPERSLQADVAARYALPLGQLAVYGYDYRLIDLVERYESRRDVFQFRNRGRARLQGVEVAASLTPTRDLSVEVGGHLARGRADDGTPLDDVAPAMLTVTTRQRLAHRGYLQARVAALAADRRPGPTEVSMTGGTLVDVGGGWRLHPLVDARVLVRNALDTALYASPDPRWVYAPGRALSLTLVVGR